MVDSLDRLKRSRFRDSLMRQGLSSSGPLRFGKRRAAPAVAAARTNQAGGFGFIGGGESTASTPADINALTNRATDRARFGRYGKGGLEREKLLATQKIADTKAGAIRDVAKTRLTGTKYTADTSLTGVKARVTGRGEVETSRRAGFDLRTKAIGDPAAKQAKAALITANKPVYRRPILGQTPAPLDKYGQAPTDWRYDEATGQKVPIPLAKTKKKKKGTWRDYVD